MRIGINLTFLFLASLALSACVTDNNAIGEILLKPGQAAVSSAQTATVADFVEAYSANSAKANSDYARKWVKLRGIVTDVRKFEAFKGTGNTDYYLVDLKDSTKKTDKVLSCRFNFNKRSEVESLKTGNVVTILGQVDVLGNSLSLPMLMNSSLTQ